VEGARQLADAARPGTLAPEAAQRQLQAVGNDPQFRRVLACLQRQATAAAPSALPGRAAEAGR
jgi:hypothetical protein